MPGPTEMQDWPTPVDWDAIREACRKEPRKLSEVAPPGTPIPVYTTPFGTAVKRRGEWFHVAVAKVDERVGPMYVSTVVQEQR